jgi:hypothetical protein
MGQTDNLMKRLADRTQMNLMHMVSGDAARTPTFVMFADPDYYLCLPGGCPAAAPFVVELPGFAWNHGDYQSDITTTWLGLVGPDVRRLGTTGNFWTDHADVRPTLLSLTGLKDDYSHQGRPITEVMTEDEEGLNRLAAVYKQIDAPMGQLSMDSLAFTTKAMMSTSAQTYTNADAKITAWTNTRNALAAKMIVLLDPTAPGSDEDDNSGGVHSLIVQGQQLLAEVHAATS